MHACGRNCFCMTPTVQQQPCMRRYVSYQQAADELSDSLIDELEMQQLALFHRSFRSPRRKGEAALSSSSSGGAALPARGPLRGPQEGGSRSSEAASAAGGSGFVASRILLSRMGSRHLEILPPSHDVLEPATAAHDQQPTPPIQPLQQQQQPQQEQRSSPRGLARSRSRTLDNINFGAVDSAPLSLYMHRHQGSWQQHPQRCAPTEWGMVPTKQQQSRSELGGATGLGRMVPKTAFGPELQEKLAALFRMQMDTVRFEAKNPEKPKKVPLVTTKRESNVP